MGFYQARVFYPLMDRSLDSPAMRDERRSLLSPARGRILELGVGTGLNLPHYGPEAQHVTALGLESTFDRRAAARAEACRATVDYTCGDACRLSFGEQSFDTVVATLVLCSVPEPEQAIAEAFRVLVPGGELLLFEHVVRPRPFGRALQRALDPLNRLVGCGCSLLRDHRATLSGVGFVTHGLEERSTLALPWLHAWVLTGRAVRVRPDAPC